MEGLFEDKSTANGTGSLNYSRYNKVKSVNSQPEDVEESGEHPDLANMLEDGCLQHQPNYRTFSSRPSSVEQRRPSLPDGIVPAYRAVFLVANAALGSGLLNFPQAYKNAGGIINAVAVQCVLLVFIIGAFMILARCAARSQSSTYQDVVMFMCGRKAKIICEILIVVYFLGACITYLIIIGDQISKVLKYALNEQSVSVSRWYTDNNFLMTVISVVFILPLCIPKRLKVLSYSSFLGGFGVFFITFIIIYKYYAGNYKVIPLQPPQSDDKESRGWLNTMTAIPVICFSYQCHVSSVAVYADLNNRSILKFFTISVMAMVICSTAYILSGTYGFLTFGQNTLSDILLNYDSSDKLANVARVMIVLIIFSSFAIITFCARTAIDSMLLSWRNVSPEQAKKHERCRRLIETFLWFGIALLIAALIPNIGAAIALIGGLAALFIFVFTGLCLMQSVNIHKEHLTARDITLLVISVLYVVVGVFIFGENTTLAIMKDIDPKSLF